MYSYNKKCSYECTSKIYKINDKGVKECLDDCTYGYIQE